MTLRQFTGGLPATLFLTITSIIVLPLTALAQSLTETHYPESTVQNAGRTAAYGFDLFQVGDWVNGAEFLRLAIEVSPDACIDSYYGELLELAREAGQMQQEGVNSGAIQQWWYLQSRRVHEDCGV